MSTDAQQQWERERVVSALTGENVCPVYFNRFGSGSAGRHFDWAATDGETGPLWILWPTRPAICVHRPAAATGTATRRRRCGRESR